MSKSKGKSVSKTAKKAAKPSKSAASTKGKGSASAGKSVAKGSSKPVAKVTKKPPAKVEAKAAAKPAAKPAPVPPPVKQPMKDLGRGMIKKGASGELAPKIQPPPVSLDDKNKPKGITIVDNRPSARRPPKPKKVVEMPQLGAPLIGPGKKWKHLIASGPNAPKITKNGTTTTDLKGKSTLSKKELEHYRAMLIKKRGELVGDISTMEGAALKDSSGSLSNVPQHAAEQGSEAYDQSLSLDIAEVDRQLIREIDEALQRMEDGSYGLCQMTGKAISKERLEELPWTRYSIEAAREREKRMFFVPRGSDSGGGSRSSAGSAASGD